MTTGTTIQTTNEAPDSEPSMVAPRSTKMVEVGAVERVTKGRSVLVVVRRVDTPVATASVGSVVSAVLVAVEATGDVTELEVVELVVVG